MHCRGVFLRRNFLIDFRDDFGGHILAARHGPVRHLASSEVADIAQVTEVTIRNRYQEQIEAMGIQ